MAVKDEEDRAVKQKDVDLKKGDVPLNFKSDELKKFELEPKKAPHNKAVGGQPLKTDNDKYNEAKRTDNKEGQEAIKSSREKFAKKKDDPAGIASADVGSKSIKKSLDQTDPQRKSQVLPQMYDKFGMIQGILKSSSSGQQGQSQAQIDSSEPESYSDLDGNTKELLISVMTHALAMMVRNFGYNVVLDNFKLATTGFYTEAEAKAVNMSGSFTTSTYRFDNLVADYQDVVVSSLTYLFRLVQKYGETNVPFIQPYFKTKTEKIPAPLVGTPTKYSVLKFYLKNQTEPYPGYAEWEKTDGTTEYVLRTESLPDLESADLLVVYLSAYALAYDLLSIMPQTLLTINKLGQLLYTYTQKIERDYMNYTLGWESSSDTVANGTPNSGDQAGGGGGGNKGSMLQQLLPQLQQLMQKTQQNHLPNSVLENGKMNKLLENFRQKKTENKRMAKFADSGLFGGGDMTSGIGSMFQNGNMSGLLSQFSSGGGGGGGGGQSGAGSTTTPTTTTPYVKPAETPITTPDIFVNTTNITNIIKGVYRTYLGRGPDQAGLNYWEVTFAREINQFGLSNATNRLIGYFKASDEYLALNNLIKADQNQINPNVAIPSIGSSTTGDAPIGYEGKL